MTDIYLTDNTGVILTASSEVSTSWVLTDLDGYFGGVGVRSNDTDRMDSGVFGGPVFRSGREITISGVVDCESVTEAERVARKLSGMFGPTNTGDTYGILRAVRHPFDLTTKVRLDGKPTIAVTRDRFGGRTGRIVTWQIPLYAPDPRMYGPDREYNATPPGTSYGLDWPLFDDGTLSWGETTGVSPEIHNYGNAPAFPTMIVTGNLASGFKLGDGTGNWIEWQNIVVPSTPVVVDFYTHQVLVNGSDQTAALTRRDWWSIPPDSGMSLQFYPIQSGGSAVCRVLVNDTYM